VTATQLAIWTPAAPEQLDLFAPEAPAPAAGASAPGPADDRCSTCHRDAHRPGLVDIGHHGHPYTPPAPRLRQCATCTGQLITCDCGGMTCAGLQHATNASHFCPATATGTLTGCAAELADPGAPCGCCARRQDEDHAGHAYRPQGTPRPRGEAVFPVGSLVRLAGGPRWARGCLGIVTDVVSKAMRQVDLGQMGAPGGMWEVVGVKGLVQCDGRGQATGRGGLELAEGSAR
jgi:hypothetical protein